MKKLRNRIEFVGLEYKTELIKIIIFFAIPLVFSVILYIFLKSLLIVFGGICLSIILEFLLLNSYKNKEEQILNNRDEEFVNIINYFRTFIANGNNVYQSFRKLVEYSSFWMRDAIEDFLHNIDQDKSVKPYIDFANRFRVGFAKNIMLSIFQMVDMGGDDNHLQQFEILFTELTRKSKEELKDKRTKTLTTYASFPVVGAAYLTILLSISIISVMGELINVL